MPPETVTGATLSADARIAPLKGGVTVACSVGHPEARSEAFAEACLVGHSEACLVGHSEARSSGVGVVCSAGRSVGA